MVHKKTSFIVQGSKFDSDRRYAIVNKLIDNESIVIVNLHAPIQILPFLKCTYYFYFTGKLIIMADNFNDVSNPKLDRSGKLLPSN